jgi:hypothetical protein
LYYTRNNGLGFEFKTRAQRITYLGRKGDKQGSMQIYVDGVSRGTYNRYATSYVGQQPIEVSLTNLSCPTGSTPAPTPVPPPPPPAPAPVVNLTANGSGGPITVTANSNVTLSWTTTNATSCSASGTVTTTNWSGSKSISGVQLVAIASSRILTLTCTGSGGTTTDSVVINTTSTSGTNKTIQIVNVPLSSTQNGLGVDAIIDNGVTYQGETASNITYSGNWTIDNNPGYLGGQARWTRTAGVSATYSTTSSSIQLRTKFEPTTGSFDVYVNGVKLRNYNVNSSITRFDIITITL